MLLVYLLTIVISTTWILKMINQKKIILTLTPLDIPLALFLISQILSTIFSIDRHTSVFGYYSRLNGGLFSTLSYILLFYALVSNFSFDSIQKFLKGAIFGGLVVALYAIPEHFGLSPSCYLLNRTFSADCWVQDVQARVFATLGQPNWLAAYLGMLIFPSLYFFLAAKSSLSRNFYLFSTTAFYLAFTFTYSRGASLGLLAGLFIFSGYCLYTNISSKIKNKLSGLLPLGLVLALFVFINLLYGSALTGDFRLIKKGAPPPRPGISVSQTTGTQLENGGTESGRIRLIVWKGTIDIFKAYPLFGSGVETFAYSYYNFRPISHNYVSEWDFLYNKAHNEYLNYLATTGAFGFISYMSIIFSFIFFCLKKILSKVKSDENYSCKLLIAAIFASYLFYLIQNFFLFSVVIVALFFFLFPVVVFFDTNSLKPLSPKKINPLLLSIVSFIYRKPLTTNLVQILVILSAAFLVFTVGTWWLADFYYRKGSNYNEAGKPGKAYENLVMAAALNRGEPIFKSDLGYAASSIAIALSEEDATRSARYKKIALDQTEQSLDLSPKNVSLYRSAFRTYFQLALIDKDLEQTTLKTLDQAIKLAPTDAKLYYQKGVVLQQFNKLEEAAEPAQKAVELKPNYKEAHFLLAELYTNLQQKENAEQEIKEVLKITPNDPDALKKQEEIATLSANTP
ncbi:O-antigen ligase family protein [Candidatus Daviesbacteria bacterium]|nr:O-antigen ligase family protein [Candidatus Daviesbacteria bacterium]